MPARPASGVFGPLTRAAVGAAGGTLAIAVLACTVIDREIPADARPSAGCGRPGPGAGPFTRELEVAGAQRSYVVRYPGSYDPNFPFPLVFALHGANGDGREIREYSDIESVSRASAIYVYPDGQAAQPGYVWDAHPDSPDLVFLETIREDISNAQCVDEARVFALGFSNGAAMAHAYACFTGSVRAIAAMAGGAPPGACAGPVAAWVGHLRDDEVVPIELGERARDGWRAQNGCDDEGQPEGPGPCTSYACESAPVWWCETESEDGYGHTWPAWASESAWSFFSTLEPMPG